MEFKFPKEFLATTFKNDLQVGAIIHRFEDDFREPKNKFSVIVGISEDGISVARSYVNSDVNINVLDSSELRSLQVDILKRNYDFLKEEYSFIDCSKIKEIKYEDLKDEYLKNQRDFFKDKLNDEDLRRVKDKLHNASTIKPIYKKLYNL